MAKPTKITKIAKIGNFDKLDLKVPGGVGGCLYRFPGLLGLYRRLYRQILSKVSQLSEIAIGSLGNLQKFTFGDHFTLHP